MRLCASLLLAMIFASGCKPEKPDVVEARREVAKERLVGAQEASQVKQATKKLSDVLKEGQAAVVVARVGERTITVGDIARQIDSESVELRSRYATPQGRRKLVEEMVERELLVAEAERKGLGRHPTVQYAWKKAMVDLYRRQLGGTMTASQVSDTDAQAYYDTHLSEYTIPEKRRAAVLIVGSPKNAASIRTELLAAVADAPVKTRQIFGDFTKRYTQHETTKLVNGDLGWFDAEGEVEGRRLPPEISSVREAFKLDMNAISEVYGSEGGFAVLQLTGLKPQRTKPFDDARLDIKIRLLADVRQKERRRMIAEMVKNAKVEIHEDVLKSLSPTPKGEGTKPKTPPKPTKVAPVPKGTPHPALITRPRLTDPRGLRKQLPIKRPDRQPSLNQEEVLKKMRERSGK